MDTKKIAAPLELIDPEHLKNDERFLFEINYEMFPEDTVRTYKKGSYLVIHTVFWSKFRKCWAMDQEEFPLAALPWIIDRFENGFWKKPQEGGLSVDEHCVEKIFDGERIGINPVANCCAENLFGYSIWNASRKNYISHTSPQDWQIPRYMLLEQGIFAKLKSIAEAYERGDL